MHNHFFYDEPKVYFMHIGGRGEPEKLAAGVKAVWDAIKKVRAAHATPDVGFDEIGPQADEIEPKIVEEIVGHKGPDPGRSGENHDRPRGD